MRYTFNRISFGLSALICIVTSCSTTDTPQPDLASVVAGTYRVTFIDTSASGPVTLPSGSNERIIVNSKGKNLIDIVNQFSTGTSTIVDISLTGSTTNVTFKKTNSNGNLSGSFSGSQMNYSILITTGDYATIRAVKI
jgi:hypothetical protein